MVMVNAWLAGRSCMFLGLVNLQEGIAVVAGIDPIGAGLQDPPLTWAPLVIVCLVLAQKLMKLFDDVKDATWPAAGTC